MRQANAHHDDGSDKFEVGRRLTFTGYSDDVHASTFKPGDIVTVAERNGCGMGIDVIGPDGQKDMVWPDEVTS